jgi:hypothetical protein
VTEKMRKPSSIKNSAPTNKEVGLGVGYELGYALAMKKPVLCLYRSESEHPLSAMISGNPVIKTVVYSSIDDAKKVLAGFLKDKR